MNRQLPTYTLQPADRVVVPKGDLRAVQHHGIYAGKNEFAQHVFVHNSPGLGVHAITDADFFRGAPFITRVEPFIGSVEERNAALIRAKNRLGSKYGLFNYNCEHFSNEVQHGESISLQVRNAIIAAVLLFFWLFSKLK